MHGRLLLLAGSRWIGVSSPSRPLRLMDPLVGATHPVSQDDRSTHLFRCCSYIQHRCLRAAYPHALKHSTKQTPSLQFECIWNHNTDPLHCRRRTIIQSSVCMCYVDKYGWESCWYIMQDYMCFVHCRLRKGVCYANIICRTGWDTGGGHVLYIWNQLHTYRHMCIIIIMMIWWWSSLDMMMIIIRYDNEGQMQWPCSVYIWNTPYTERWKTVVQI